VIQIKSAYLIGIDMWRTDRAKIPFVVKHTVESESPISELAHPTWIMVATGASLDEVIYEVEYRYHGFAGRMHTIFPCKRTLPEFWETRANGTYLDVYSENEYLVWKAIARLRPEAVHELAKMDRIESRHHQDELLEAIFPECTGERIRTATDFETGFSSVLYIEPEEAFSVHFRSLEDYAASIKQWLGAKQTVPQPHHLVDVVLMHGIGYGVPAFRMLAIGEHPLEYPDTSQDVHIPKSVMNIVLRYGYLRQLLDLATRLRELPFYRSTADEYSASLGRSPRQIARNYRKLFLHDRAEELAERLADIQAADEIRNRCKTDYVSIFAGSLHSRNLTTGDASAREIAYGFDVLEYVGDEIDSADKKVRASAELIRQRANGLGELLRDMFAAYANSSNLALQRWIRALTLLALATSLLALAFGVLLNRL